MKTQFAASNDDDNPLYMTDNFRMYCFKVLPCSKRFCHDWTTCPFAHPQEKAKRRPRLTSYTGVACPDMKKNAFCPRGESCSFAHNVFEYWCHPSRYRTQLCNDGATCSRKGCFFAHTLDELRQASVKVVLPGDASAAAALPPPELLDSCSSDPFLTHSVSSGREDRRAWRSSSACHRNMSSQPSSPTWSPTATVTGDLWEQASERPSAVSLTSSRGSSRGSSAVRNDWRLHSKDPRPSRYSGGDLAGEAQLQQLQLATVKNLQQAAVLQSMQPQPQPQSGWQQQQQPPAWEQEQPSAWQQQQQQPPAWQQQQQPPAWQQQQRQQQPPAWQQQQQQAPSGWQQQQQPSMEQLVHAIAQLQMVTGVSTGAYAVSGEPAPPPTAKNFNLQPQPPQGCLPSLMMLHQVQQQQQHRQQLQLVSGRLAGNNSNFCIPEEAAATMMGGGGGGAAAAW